MLSKWYENKTTRKQWETIEYCMCIANKNQLYLDTFDFTDDEMAYKFISESDKDCIEAVDRVKSKVKKGDWDEN